MDEEKVEDLQQEMEVIQLEPNSNRPDKKKKKGFLFGLIAGVLGAIIVADVALLGFMKITGSRIYVLPQTVKSADTSLLNQEVNDKINLLNSYIQSTFVDEVSDEVLAQGMYKGLMESLDDQYSAYYTPEEYENLQISATQNYYGIGAGLLQDEKTMAVTISKVYEGTPAEEAGLKNNDVIVSVDDIDATSMDVSELVTYIRGEEGTSVRLQIMREGENDLLSFEVKRANVDLPTISEKLLENAVGYIRITEFGSGTTDQFKEAILSLESQGMESLIIDVRDNPGGMVTTVVDILDILLPEGVVVYTKDKQGKQVDYTSSNQSKVEYPIAVLINGNSASASEILAGAIRDFDYGTLIGTTSFGKGIVQTIIPLDAGDAIKLTTAKYYTPSGENIQGTGIEPDITLDYEYDGDTESEYDEMQDNQVQKAIEELQKERLNDKE